MLVKIMIAFSQLTVEDSRIFIICQQMIKDSTPPITLKIRRLRRHWNIPTTYIVNYDPRAEIGLSLRMFPSIRIEVYIAATEISHHNEG